MDVEQNATTLIKFAHSYRLYHGYISLTLCIYGLITNIINICVLTKKSMLSPINCILTGIAVADMITMSSYIPFAIVFFILTPQETFGSIVFLTVHTNITLISHTTSIWLGVIMAVMRYIMVQSTGRGANSITCRCAKTLIIFTFLGAATLMIPNCLVTKITPVVNSNDTRWELYTPPVDPENTTMMVILTFLIYPIGGKIIPIILISIFGGLLLRTLRETDRRGRRLRGSNSNSHNQNRRTTVMLLCIITMYIISEVPQSILVILCVAVPKFLIQYYNPLSDVIDIIALINSAVNFFMYCTMSKQFRSCLLDSLRSLWPREFRSIHGQSMLTQV